MGLSFHVPKFIKNPFVFRDEDDQSSHPSSPAQSIYEAEMSITSPKMKKYLYDPMCASKRPDVVGHYYDPMGGRFSHCHGTDPTNTGA
ncbi:hypothetical protein CLU79DRAFT_735938 [Phycomyces nitens]|nr:hypothetical protein CLU79DRAFT_735938 [Phycomyces nitens]